MMPQRGFLFDPIRKREVAATPEEKVRQALVHYFLDDLGVPARLLAVEYDLRHIHPQSRGRLDVVAFMPGEQGLMAWAMAECKAPDIAVNESTARQLERYVAILPCRYLMATNGLATHSLERHQAGDQMAFRAIASLPRFALASPGD